MEDSQRSRAEAVESQQFGLAATGDVVEARDPDRGKSASRWCADLGEVDF
jgi:hypothetical protein